MPEFPYHPTLDVYRDKDGNPVTVTPEQCAAVMHAVRVWHQVRVEEGYYTNKGDLGERLRLDPTNVYHGFPTAEITKSCLLGRMLYDGRPPMAEPPPVAWSAPQYAQVDPALCPTCGTERAALPRANYISIAKPGHREIRYCAEQWHAVRPEAERVYDILEWWCGASWHDRDGFITWFDGVLGDEWRFQGSLGFGGKLWRGRGVSNFYVNCYPEDETPERLEMIAMANTAIRLLRGA